MSDDFSDRVLARARLAVRAEAAFGLKAVVGGARRISLRSRKRPNALPLAASQRNEPKSEPEPAPQTVTLFGEVADAKGKLLETPNDQPFDAPPPPTDEKIRALKVLDDTEVKGCTRCVLSQTRQHTVFGEGSPDAKVFFVGEGPGANEDETGRPFVGRAGELLDKMIVAMGLSREEVYIANVVKCRPPGNRVPAAGEVEACTPYLVKQLDWVRPAAIVTLGLPATHFLLGGKTGDGEAARPVAFVARHQAHADLPPRLRPAHADQAGEGDGLGRLADGDGGGRPDGAEEVVNSRRRKPRFF